MGVTLTLKSVNLWTLIESDTGSHKLFGERPTEKLKNTEYKVRGRERKEKNYTPKSKSKGRRKTKTNINRDEEKKRERKMSDKPVQNTRSEKIESIAPGPAPETATNKNNHQQCSAPNNSVNKPVIYLSIFVVVTHQCVYHIDFPKKILYLLFLFSVVGLVKPTPCFSVQLNTFAENVVPNFAFSLLLTFFSFSLSFFCHFF